MTKERTSICFLKYNQGTGEGGVILSDKFNSMNSLFRADVLKDWIRDLEQAYKEASGDAFDTLDD